jgi:4-amino-4-deoxy-L-arabinose transferase and related glycosyltransferases of PMT family
MLTEKRITPWEYLILLSAIAINFSGLFIPVLGPDGDLYAFIAKTMAQKNDFINLYYVDGSDWLDKPHFPFWVTALSFKIFGTHAFSYKLPAILFLLMGAYYTYRFALKAYNRRIAVWSAIILLTAEHIIISNNDVRAEPYLTGLVIAATYYFYLSTRNKKFYTILLGALFTAAAVMTKGIFVIFPIGGAIAGGLAFSRNWKQLFNLRWLAAAILIFIFITPELYCLWYQFDLHPEKTVFGRTNVSGIKFFFWDSQFGRFSNQGPIKGHGDYLFFVHTILWAFLPWCLFFYAAVFSRVAKAFQKNSQFEYFTFSGAVITFILFSLSSFQLPHYTNIIFPFFAIISASYLFHIKQNSTLAKWMNVQNVLITLLIIATLLLNYFYFSSAWMCWFICFTPATVVIIFIYRENFSEAIKMVLASAAISIAVNAYLNNAFYPSLLQYQSGSEAALFLNENYKGRPVTVLIDGFNFDIKFYLDAPVITPDSAQLISPNLKKGDLILIDKDKLPLVKAPFKIVKTFSNFKISELNTTFLNRETRAGTLNERLIIEII